MRKPLPLKQWIALEHDVARNKAEIAQAFAEARARLLPEPKPNEQDLRNERMRWQMAMLTNAHGMGSCDPSTGALILDAGFDNPYRRGLFGLGFLGL